MRLRLDLAYDGHGFSGWAKQPGRPSVQQSVESAFEKVFRLPADHISTVVAGRTDAGVHAIGQVCHIDIPDEYRRAVETAPALALTLRRLRGVMGRGGPVWLKDLCVAPEGFDARFSALSRRYEYRIAGGDATRDPRRAGHTLWWDGPLDGELMNELGSALLGLRDFAAFCRPRAGASTIRTLQNFRWLRDEAGVLVANVQADAFCHSMVRSLVGAAVAVGSLGLTVAEVLALRDGLQRTSAWKTMPALGLTLMEVVYPADSELARRGEQTRAKRPAVSD